MINKKISLAFFLAAVVLAMFPHLAAVFSSGWRYDAARQYESAVRAMIAGWAGAGEVADD